MIFIKETPATFLKGRFHETSRVPIDSFTTQPFSGNPAGFIANVDGLSSAQMQRIACELNNSETAFIFRPKGPDHDIRIRFFTPTTEVPSFGHAAIAAHFVRALEGGVTDETLVQKTGAGLMPIRITSQNGQLWIAITQAAPTFEPPLAPAIAKRVVQALKGHGSLQDDFPM